MKSFMHRLFDYRLIEMLSDTRPINVSNCPHFVAQRMNSNVLIATKGK